jgi:hypothetical protein
MTSTMDKRKIINILHSVYSNHFLGIDHVIPQLPNPKDGYGKGLHHNKKMVTVSKLLGKKREDRSKTALLDTK